MRSKSRYLDCLKRRLEFLIEKVKSSKGFSENKLHHISAEISALEWALEILIKEIKEV